jgi:uncharacterized protein (UPF0276 family)
LGLGWRPETARLVLGRDDLAFCEVIAENVNLGFQFPGPLDAAIARGIEVIPHGIGLSLGGTERPDPRRLSHLAAVADAVGARLVSEHVAFVRAGGREAGHLLPIPRTRAALDVLVDNVKEAQDALPVPLVLEQVAALVQWPDAEMDEPEFLTALVERADVDLLLDLANLHVNANNFGYRAIDVLDRLPLERVAYVHVAGGTMFEGMFHDTHAHPIWPEVLLLVEALAERIRAASIMLERDDNYPPDAELEVELDAITAAFEKGLGHEGHAVAG